MTRCLLHYLADQGSATSDNGSVISNCLSSISDSEQHILASNNPKKRAGRKIFRETRHPIYRGVRRRNSGKWVCEMREPNKKSRIWLGTYPTVEMAARAHDVAAIALRGKSACLNFADSAWRLPIPTSTEIKDIQKAATEAAETFRPSGKVDEAVKEVDHQVPSSEYGNVINEGVFSPKDNLFSVEDDVFFMDEDEIFGMPRLITSMAEALMLPPPIMHHIEEDTHEHHMQLWNFSMCHSWLF